MKKKAILPVMALALSLVMCLGACGTKSAKVQSKTDKTELSTMQAPISMGGNYYLVKPGEESTVPEGGTAQTYDFSVTTFNVGGFAAGVDNGITKDTDGYGWSDALTAWDRDIPKFTSDIYAMQEFSPMFYKEKQGGQVVESSIIWSKDKFASVFSQLETVQGATNFGEWEMNSALAATTVGGLTLKNISTGYLGGKSESERRCYIKGYVTVKGVDVAIYCVHLGFNDYQVDINTYYELIEMMRNEDYCIVMGDMNSDRITPIMQKYGFASANQGEFGKFNTYINGTDRYIDNIFVSKNITMEYAECLCTDSDTSNDNRGYSDHLPLTAYLTVNTEMGSAKDPITFNTDADGFVAEYYK